MKISLLIIYLVFRAYVSFYAFFFDKSWCHVAIVVMTWLRFLADLAKVRLAKQLRSNSSMRSVGVLRVSVGERHVECD